jgi:hypothetical protein
MFLLRLDRRRHVITTSVNRDVLFFSRFCSFLFLVMNRIGQDAKGGTRVSIASASRSTSQPNGQTQVPAYSQAAGIECIHPIMRYSCLGSRRLVDIDVTDSGGTGATAVDSCRSMYASLNIHRFRSRPDAKVIKDPVLELNFESIVLGRCCTFSLWGGLPASSSR